MADRIVPIPPVPKGIVEAVNRRKLAVFIGAGVSRLIGCKGWDELARNLVEKCYHSRKQDGHTCINFRERETLLQMKDHKKVITICHHLLNESGLEHVFMEELKASLQDDKELSMHRNIYNELWGLRGVFITTNVDQHFDRKFEPKNILYKPEHFHSSQVDPTKLYHIHGWLPVEDSLIFTVPQYIKRYNDPNFKPFLRELFEKYTVLFVGYGLAEFELLDFLITKFDSNTNKELRHFILLPFYRGEENILKFEEYYYNSMGISVIPYEKDERGYDQLYEVLKNWNSEINKTSTYLYSSFQEIQEAVNNFDEAEATRVLQLIKNDKPQEEYFFSELSATSTPFPWLKILKEKGYFDPSKNPAPEEDTNQKGYFRIPYWNVLGYLENVAIQNKEKPSPEITNLLLEIIDSIIDYKNEEDDRIDNYITDSTIIKIAFSLPIESISQKHVEFLRTALTSKWDTMLIAGEISKTVFPKLIEGQDIELVLKLLEIIFDYKKENNSRGSKYTSIMDEYWLDKSLKKYKPAIAELCGIEAAKITIEKIKYLSQENDHTFNTIWIPTIEDHPQTRFSDRYECILVQFVRDMLQFSQPRAIKTLVCNLIRERHPILKRIGIHIINYHYQELNDLFWEWDGNPLNESALKHELYELLKNHSSSFSDEEIKRVLEWIEAKDYNIQDIEQPEKTLAYLKKEWLSALLGSKNPEVIALYNEYNDIAPEELRHPGLAFWSETVVGTESPIEVQEFLTMSNEEIAGYLRNFKEQKGWRQPSKEGLSQVFRRCVLENPKKFTQNLEPFMKVPTLYQYNLLWGLCDAWREGKDFEWGGVLNFISKIIESDDFWTKEENGQYKNSIVIQVADLIEKGTERDKHAFNPEFLPIAEDVLLNLVDKAESTVGKDETDLVTAVLNSPKGKVFSAMVIYSLRYARVFSKTKKVRWPLSIKEEFDKRLNRNIEPSLDFSLTLGKYLANLAYLDMEWLENKINEIFLNDNENHWKAAIEGYLFYASTVHQELYLLLRENGHYEKALNTEFEDNHIKERLIQHICVGYIEDWENVEEQSSLISKIINRNKPNELSEIVSFFWMLRENLNDKIRSKVKQLWKALFENAADKVDSLEYQKILSNLSRWLVLVEEIDEEVYGWLKVSARYVKTDYNSSFFVEYLLKHVDKTPGRVGELFLEMLNSGAYPDYKKENIEEIVEKLYGKGEKEIADKICNSYGEKGIYYLRDIYEKHHAARLRSHSDE